MFKGLLTDCMIHFRECIVLNASLFVSLIAGYTVLKKTGRKTDDRIKALLLLACISFVLLIFPVSASVIRIVFGTYYDVPDIWGIIPLIPLGGVCVSAMAGELFKDFSGEKKSTVILCNALLAAAVLICGSLGTPEETMAGRSENASIGEAEVAQLICDRSMDSGSAYVVLANDDITAALHTLSADVVTLYGRDMWDGRLTKNRLGTYSQELRQLRDDLLKMEDNKFYLAPEVCREGFSFGADIVVVPGGCDPASFEAEGLYYEEFTASNGERFYLVYGGIL
ncbi:MAG: hypothetical protein KBG42_01175 [Lachnospiraceae bacterium]|nr:hypothetical protein [Lachnospiraceae bacterium]